MAADFLAGSSVDRCTLRRAVSDVLLALLAALFGAIAAGGIDTVVSWRQRTLQRKVAARLILGDLYVLEAAIDVVLERRQWPDPGRFDFGAPVQTWRENREAFAAAVKAWEWAVVDGVYSNLARTAPMARPGERINETDAGVLASLKDAVVKARDVVVSHATTEAERREITQRLGPDAPGAGVVEDPRN
jgi:hypothetical protein